MGRRARPQLTEADRAAVAEAAEVRRQNRRDAQARRRTQGTTTGSTASTALPLHPIQSTSPTQLVSSTASVTTSGAGAWRSPIPPIPSSPTPFVTPPERSQQKDESDEPNASDSSAIRVATLPTQRRRLHDLTLTSPPPPDGGLIPSSPLAQHSRPHAIPPSSARVGALATLRPSSSSSESSKSSGNTNIHISGRPRVVIHNHHTHYYERAGPSAAAVPAAPSPPPTPVGEERGQGRGRRRRRGHSNNSGQGPGRGRGRGRPPGPSRGQRRGALSQADNERVVEPPARPTRQSTRLRHDPEHIDNDARAASPPQELPPPYVENALDDFSNDSSWAPSQDESSSHASRTHSSASGEAAQLPLRRRQRATRARLRPHWTIRHTSADPSHLLPVDLPTEYTVAQAIQLAAGAVQSSLLWDGCSCERPLPAEDDEALSLAAMADYFEHTLAIPDALMQTGIHSVQQIKDWYELLTGGESPAKLSFAASEYTGDLQIQRTFDIDAIMAVATSLAVFKRGARFTLYPRHRQIVTNDLHIAPNGSQMHRTKHTILAYSSIRSDWRIYAVFPVMPFSIASEATPALNDIQRRTWLDEILLPAIAESFPASRLQRLPASFRTAHAHARAKQSEGAGDTLASGHQLDIAHIISGTSTEYDALWCAIQRRIEEQPQDLREFKGVFLFLHNIDSKAYIRQQSIPEVRSRLAQVLDQVIDMRYVDDSQMWVDLAVEDIPRASTDEAITLLWKIPCVKHLYTSLLDAPHPQIHPFLCTRDAGSARSNIRKRHAIYRGGLCFAQSYNINKAVTSLPTDTRHHYFDSPYYDTLALPESLAQQMVANSTSQVRYNRRRVLHSYFTQKQRLDYSNRDADFRSFGVRHELRLTQEQLQSPIHGPLVRLYDSDAHSLAAYHLLSPPVGDYHRPYWVLYTADVNRFCRWSANRWLFAVDSLAAKVGDSVEGASTYTASELEAERTARSLDASHMSKMLLSCARIQINSEPPWETRAVYRAIYANGERVGLDFETSITEFGMPWLPSDLINWETKTLLDPDRTDFVHSAFRGLLRDHKPRQAAATRSYAGNERLREALDDASSAAEILQVQMAMYQRIAQLYAEWAISRYAALEGIALDALTESERRGYHGLGLDLLERVGPPLPHVVCARPSRRNENTVAPVSGVQVSDRDFAWDAQVQHLLDWDDGAIRCRPWKYQKYRIAARNFADIVTAVRGEQAGRLFKRNLGRYVVEAGLIRVMLAFGNNELTMAAKYGPARRRLCWRATYSDGRPWCIVSTVTELQSIPKPTHEILAGVQTYFPLADSPPPSPGAPDAGRPVEPTHPSPAPSQGSARSSNPLPLHAPEQSWGVRGAGPGREEWVRLDSDSSSGKDSTASQLLERFRNGD